MLCISYQRFCACEIKEYFLETRHTYFGEIDHWGKYRLSVRSTSCFLNVLQVLLFHTSKFQSNILSCNTSIYNFIPTEDS